jgi:hypothetical protein
MGWTRIRQRVRTKKEHKGRPFQFQHVTLARHFAMTMAVVLFESTKTTTIVNTTYSLRRRIILPGTMKNQ